MKIIGTIGDGNFLVEATCREIDYLAGRTVGSQQGYYSSDRKIQTGTTFNIVNAFDQIHRNNQRKSEVESLRATLKAILVGLDMIEPLIEEPKTEEKTAEVSE